VSDDRGAIEGLLADYADHIDDGNFDAVGQLFAEGVICDAEGTPLAAGATAVTDLYEATTRRYPDGTPRTHHVTSNVAIAITGDSAQCRSRFTVFQAADGGDLRPVITGRYRDRFVLVDGRWRFAERRMDPRLTGDLTAHLLIDLPSAADAQ
jgi:3-phenylpropionate/cinnamic acid dioxygenase small subunit